jgi:hypothetical protein
MDTNKSGSTQITQSQLAARAKHRTSSEAGAVLRTRR